MTSLPTCHTASGLLADGLLNRLRILMDNCGDSKPERAVVLISACIEEGITSGKDIVATLKNLDFKPRHIGLLLHTNTGNDPRQYHWCREGAGAYRNHPTS